MLKNLQFRIGVLLLVWLVVAFVSSCSRSTSNEKNESRIIEFVNGKWFNGRRFQPATFYSVRGLIQRKKPLRVHDVVDLEEGFVIPPFGEAHNHNIEASWNADAVIRNYLQAGIFYVKIQGNIYELASKILKKINSPNSVDVVFANAVLTGSGGHPVSMYENILRNNWYEPHLGDLPQGWFEGRSYMLVDNCTDLYRIWPNLMATKPDFIKTILSYSEDFKENRNNNSPWIRKGLSPELLPIIVEKAQKEGLRVSTHVETAKDFHHAVEAGVDEIAHLPGYYIHLQNQSYRAEITEADAKKAGIKGIIVVTTTVLSTSVLHDQSLLPLVQKIQRQNLQLLKRNNVRLAIGSDHSNTSVPEALYLHELDIFDNLTLLKIWCETTPQAIFPNRKIGFLVPGYEASFLLLDENPLKNFHAVKKIRLRVKQGLVLKSVAE